MASKVSNPWTGSSNTSKTYLETNDDPFQFNKNYSDNDLDNAEVYKERLSPNWYINHRNDIILHTGFDYRGRILKRSLSGSMYLETKRAGILNEIEKVLVFLVDSIKNIKKSYNWCLDKNYRDFN